MATGVCGHYVEFADRSSRNKKEPEKKKLTGPWAGGILWGRRMGSRAMNKSLVGEDLALGFSAVQFRAGGRECSSRGKEHNVLESQCSATQPKRWRRSLMERNWEQPP